MQAIANEVNTLTLNAVAKLIGFCNDNDDVVSYTEDINTVVNALHTFNNDNNAEEFALTLMQLDSFVRDYFACVIDYCEAEYEVYVQ